MFSQLKSEIEITDEGNYNMSQTGGALPNIIINPSVGTSSRSDDESLVGFGLRATAQQMSDITKILAAISSFNGKNIPVETFIGEIEAVHRVTQCDEGMLIQLIIVQKLQESVRWAIAGTVCNNIKELAAALRREFGSLNNYELAVSKRARICQDRDSIVYRRQKDYL